MVAATAVGEGTTIVLIDDARSPETPAGARGVGAAFAMSLFRARVTLGRRHSRDTAHAQAGREAVMITRGFAGKQSGSDHADRIPPGQHLVEYFPVLTAGPTPQVELEDWRSARTF
jgi:DMSO/TMAO reductase YedYZ molybdopterin-dependent catalytic subunit